jgi:hypothetical protein
MPPSRPSALLLALPFAALPAALASADSSASATIELNATGRSYASQLGLDVPAFETQLRDEIQEALGIAEVQRSLRAFANATSLSHRGLGVDYASNSTGGIFGIAGSVSFSTELDGELVAAGGAPNAAIMAGLNLARWNRPALTAYVNGFSYNATYERFRGRLTSVGAHLQYKLFTPTRGTKRLVAQWGGLDLTTGLELTRWRVALGGELSTDLLSIGDPATGPSTNVRTRLTGTAEVATKTTTVPLEITTNVRLLYFVSLYAGLGVDLQVGSTSIDLGASGALTGTRPDTGEEEMIGRVAVTGSGSEGPPGAPLRVVLGTQANLWRLKVFGQLTVQSEGAVTLALGTRLVL